MHYYFSFPCIVSMHLFTKTYPTKRAENFFYEFKVLNAAKNGNIITKNGFINVNYKIKVWLKFPKIVKKNYIYIRIKKLSGSIWT